MNLEELKEKADKEFDIEFKMDSNGGLLCEIPDEDGGTDYDMCKLFLSKWIETAYEAGEKNIAAVKTKKGTWYSQSFVDSAIKSVISQLIKELPEEKTHKNNPNGDPDFDMGRNQYRAEVIDILKAYLKQ